MGKKQKKIANHVLKTYVKISKRLYAILFYTTSFTDVHAALFLSKLYAKSLCTVDPSQ
jgi:hypothetical protein